MNVGGTLSNNSRTFTFIAASHNRRVVNKGIRLILRYIRTIGRTELILQDIRSSTDRVHFLMSLPAG